MTLHVLVLEIEVEVRGLVLSSLGCFLPSRLEDFAEGGLSSVESDLDPTWDCR